MHTQQPNANNTKNRLHNTLIISKYDFYLVAYSNVSSLATAFSTGLAACGTHS
jgi:hypothetical protein